MRPHRPAALAALLLALAVLPAAAQAPAPMPPPEPASPPEAPAPPADEPAEPAEEPFEFEQFQLVLLKRPAERPELPEEQVMEIQRRHIAHLTAMGEAGHLLVAGPFGDQEDESLRGLALYQVGSIEEARRLAEADPAVAAGRLEVEVMTLHVEKGYMTFPKRPAPAAGDAATPEEAAPAQHGDAGGR
jgi:uncharacterized protein